MRRAALVTLLCFGCASSRPPWTAGMQLVGGRPSRVALGEPQLELWMEGTGPVDPRESADTLERSRAALASALEGRGMDGVEDPDALLFVHARAVARTRERRSAQIWSAVAIVGVVAIVIAAVLAGRDHHPKPRRGPALAAPRAGPPARAFGPRLRPAAPPSFFWGFAVGVHAGAPYPPVPPPPPRGFDPPRVDPLLDQRGWFDGDEVEITVELVDAASGDVRYRRAVREGIDPRDAAALSALVDRAIAGLGFGRKGSPPPPALAAKIH